MTILRCLTFSTMLVLASLLSLPHAHAFTAAEESDLVLMKARVEELVVKKYRDRISTRISSDLFNVGAQVTLKLVPGELIPPQAKPAATPAVGGGLAASDLPSDISLGVLSTLQEMQKSAPVVETPGAPLRAPTSFRITRVEVFVGISPKIDASYRTPFSKWLSENVKSEFGSVGTAVVTELILPVVPEKEKPEPIKERQLTWEERFGNFQNLVGLSVLALFALLALALWKLFPSRDARERSATQLRLQEMALAQQQQLSAEANRAKRLATGGADKTAAHGLSANLLFENHREYQKKIAFIALSSREELEQAMDMWLSEGDEGRKKIASVLDCVLTHIGNALQSTQAETLARAWTLPERLRSDSDLLAIFRTFAALDLATKNSLLESAYWELLSIKTLGDKVMKKRFHSISQLPASQIERVLGDQDGKVRSVALLHLPSEKLEKVLSHMSFTDKQTMLNSVLEMSQVKESDLEIVDQTLSLMIDRDKSLNAKEGLVDIVSLLPNLLASLEPFEEIKLVLELSSKREATRQYLTANYPSLAYLPAWPTEVLRSLVNNTPSSQIVALCQVLPEMRIAITQVLPTRVKAMLQDELKRSSMSEAELNEQIRDLRARAFELVESGELDLGLLSQPQPKRALAAS